ncbi:hypothetical protein WJX84_003151 [Apatococcus fuscideae]|uniref:Uncharacterized protein n=1 Tax=Apatococcus fuscideae TaxID=2026836 RepID=A0AAW1SWT5_9CHLO
MTLNDTRAWYTGYGAAGKWESMTSCAPQFRYDLEAYLATHNSHYKSLQDIANDGLYHPTSDSRLRMNLVQGINYGTPADYPTPAQQAQGLVCGCGDFFTNKCRLALRQALIGTMDALKLDLMVYPSFLDPPRFVGDDLGPVENVASLYDRLTGLLLDEAVRQEVN